MNKKHRELIAWMLKILNVVLMAMPLYYINVFFYRPADVAEAVREQTGMLILFCILYLVYGHVYEGFEVSIGKITEMVSSQFLAILISDGLIYIVIALLKRSIPAVMPMIICVVLQTYLATVWAFISTRFYFAYFEPHKTLVVHDQKRKVEELISDYGFERKFDVQAVASAAYFLKHQKDEFADIDTVFLSGVSSQTKNDIIKYCAINNITVYLIPYIGDVIVSGGDAVHMFHLPVLRMGQFHFSPMYYVAKRAFDILASASMLILVSPILLVTAIAIKATDGGPVFYKQVRLTRGGKEFKILKFRSMRVDAEKDGVARLSTGENDDRITPVGHVIRKFRIDELPQLFNILGGSMTVVGPRPERPEIATDYKKTIPEFDLRLQVKAGLTGYAQVYGKYNTTPYDKLQMDLMYISSCNFFEDLRIIFATIKILFEPESTEGVAVGQTTAMGEDEGEES